jgi:hypothetical protein
MARKRPRNAGLACRKKVSRRKPPSAVTPVGEVPLASATPIPTIQAVRSPTPHRSIESTAVTPIPPSPGEHTMQDYQSRRIAIGYIYMHTLDAPERSEWDGEGGTVIDICERLGLGINQRKMVKECMTRAERCLHMGTEYDGSRNKMSKSKTKALLIPAGSVELQIIADSMELGYGIRLTKELVNEHRGGNDAERVGLSTVYEAYKRLNPVITVVKKRKQGTTDPDTDWSKGRLEWVKSRRDGNLGRTQ